MRRAVNALAAVENKLVGIEQSGFDLATFRDMRKQRTAYPEALGRLVEKRYENDIPAAKKRFDAILDKAQQVMEEWKDGEIPDFSLVIEHGALEDILEKDDREQRRMEYEKEKAEQERAKKEEEARAKQAAPEIRLEL